MGILSSLTDLVRGNKQSDTAGLIINKFDHYSGSQIGVWFGNIYLDDINSIQWTRQQSKRPLYGYASQNFDAVAKGTVLISGSFVVNFRQSGYLTFIMKAIEKVYGGLQDKSTWATVRGLIGTHLRNGTFGPKTVQEIQDIGNSPDFLSLAKNYEDIIWGGGTPGDSNSDGTIDRNLPSDVEQNTALPNGFNILVTYGNTSTNQARTLSEYTQSTTKSLNGVHLIGESQLIQVGGQPIQEQYEFIARNTDEYIGSSYER